MPHTQVTDKILVNGGGLASEDQLRRVLANISDITLVAVVSCMFLLLWCTVG